MNKDTENTGKAVYDPKEWVLEHTGDVFFMAIDVGDLLMMRLTDLIGAAAVIAENHGHGIRESVEADLWESLKRSIERPWSRESANQE